MKELYTVISFNTKDKKLVLLVRNTEQDAKAQIQYEINLLKMRENVLDIKTDYSTSEREVLGANEHNGYVKTEDAEYFWKTDCIVR